MSLTVDVDVDVYPSGITTVYSGGTIPTSSRVELASDYRELARRRIIQVIGVTVMNPLPAEPDAGWPPSWFGSIRSARTDTAARTEEILRAGFGRDDHR
jgi:hypothetical protein